jgi:hypothetical protein
LQLGWCRPIYEVFLFFPVRTNNIYIFRISEYNAIFKANIYTNKIWSWNLLIFLFYFAHKETGELVT